MTLTSTGAEVVKPEPVAPPAAGDQGGRGAGRWWRRRTDLLIAAAYLLGAGYAMWRLLGRPGVRITVGGPLEQSFSEWMLQHGVDVVTRFDSPFFSDRINVPDGVNIMASHGFPGLSVPLAPLTLLIGPSRTYAVVATLCLAGTAFAWYFVLSRHLVSSRPAAVVAGAFGGFAPAMIAHAQGDLGRAAQFLVPFLIWRVVKLRESGHAVRNGAVLGLLAAWQALIDQEILFLLGLGWLVFLATYAVQRRGEVRAYLPHVLRGLAVAAAVWIALLGYPMWLQFLGAHHGRGPAHSSTGADAFSYFAFATPSLATWPVGGLQYARRITEQNGFYGLPLMMLLIGAPWVLRTALVRALAATGAVLAVLSLGGEVFLQDKSTHVPGPWRLIGELPVLKTIPPLDVALAVLPAAVLVLALAGDWGARLIESLRVEGEPVRLARLAWYVLLAAALIPVAPAPIDVVDGPPPPAFLAQETWRTYVPAGRTALAIPPQWTESSRVHGIVEITFPDRGPRGEFGDLLSRIGRTGKPPQIIEADRRAARDEIVRKRIAVVALLPQHNGDLVRNAINSLLGVQSTWVDGVWLWDLRMVS
jgi:hypothetical protein